MTLAIDTNRLNMRSSLALPVGLALLFSSVCSYADETKPQTKAPSRAIYAQLEAAVRSGEMTKEEARAKLQALKLQGETKNQVSKVSAAKKTVSTPAAHLERIEKELHSLIIANQISKDDAAAVMAMLRKSVSREEGADEKSKAKPAVKEAAKKTESVVRDDKTTKEQPSEKLKAAPQKTPAQKVAPEKKTKAVEKQEAGKKVPAKAITQEHLEKIRAKLDAAVAAGKLTKDQAEAKMDALKKSKSVDKN